MSYAIDTDWDDHGVVTVTFSDPQRRNQLCWAAVDELAATLRNARERGARVVMLASGLSGHWLEHAWLQDLSAGVEGGELTGTGQGWFEVLQEVTHEDIVSIAVISGDCSGGGAEIGWACDLRVAERQARFAQPEVNFALTTGIGGSSRLSRLAGRGVTTEMVLTGRPMSPERLYALGAVNAVVEQGLALAAAGEMAQDLATKPPEAIAGLKRILAHAEGVPLEEALIHEQAVFQSTVVGEAARTTMKAVQQAYDAGVGVAEFNQYDKWEESSDGQS